MLLASSLLAMLRLMHPILMLLVVINLHPGGTFVFPSILPMMLSSSPSPSLLMLVLVTSPLLTSTATSLLTSTSASCPVSQSLSLLCSCPPLLISWTQRPLISHLFPSSSGPSAVQILPQILVPLSPSLAQLTSQVSRHWAL